MNIKGYLTKGWNICRNHYLSHFGPVSLEPHPEKISVTYVGAIAVYKLIRYKSFLLCGFDGKLLSGRFERERLKPPVIRTCQGNVTTLPQLKHVLHAVIKVS